MFKRIDHMELLTADPRRAGEFYTRVLGFRERERMRIPATPAGPLELVFKSRGVEPTWGPVKRPTYARAEIRDPDGNAIELRQWVRMQP